ncbi:MAG: glycosyltransferase family 4 protein [Planctomycetaceae bacterium]|nr:glycosyltransferase family 4 protein [Planctomycetaceae bacterium]
MKQHRKKAVFSAFGVRANVVGGLQTFARELSAQLGEAGWESVLVFSSPPADEVAPLFELPNTYVESLDFSGSGTTRALRHTAGLLRKYRPAAAHFHLLDPIRYPWLAKSLGVPNVYLTDHISRPEGYCGNSSPAWKRMAKRLAYAPVTKMIAVSDFVRDCRRREGVFAERRLARIYNGIDLSRARSGADKRAELRRSYGIPDDHFVILQVGWLIPQKGVDDLIRAAHLIRKETDKVHVLLAGDGPQRREYETLTEELGLADRVTFLGNFGDPLGAGLFAASDIVCQLSHWEEAFGLTIAEAMASGKPVIGTRVGAIPELIANDQTGVLVERGDARAIADGVLSLCGDAELRASLGANGKRVCQEQFCLTTNVKMCIQEYGIRESGHRTDDSAGSSLLH